MRANELLKEHVVLGDINPQYHEFYVVGSEDRKHLFIIPAGRWAPYQYYGYLKTGPKFISMIRQIVDNLPPGTKSGYYGFAQDITNPYKNELIAAFKDNAFISFDNDENLPISDEIKQFYFERSKLESDSWLWGQILSSLNYVLKTPSDIDKVVSDRIKVTLQEMALGYLFVDTAKRIIKPVDSTKKSHTRMGQLSGNSQYVLPMADFSLTDPAGIVKVLKSLCKKYPFMLDYKCFDPDSIDQQTTVVRDLLQGQGRIGKSSIEYANRFKIGPITVYHGTSLAKAKKILKLGLLPGQGKDYIDKIKGHSEHLVYLTVSPGEARKYAVRAGANRGSAVLEIEVRDFTKIKFDEDNWFWAVDKLNHHMDPAKLLMLKKRLVAAFGPKSGVLQYRLGDDFTFTRKDGTVMGIENNPLDPHGLKDLFGSSKTAEQKNLLNLLGYYAVKGSTSFSYEGKIPPSDIKLAETFTSTKHNDEKEYDQYDQRYDDVLATRKTY